MTNDECKAIEGAEAALDTLTPATARNDAIAFDLRYASRLMTEAMAKGGDAALNGLRDDALSAVAVSLDWRVLTQDRIDE